MNVKPWTTGDYERIRAMREKRMQWHEVAYALGRTMVNVQNYVRNVSETIGQEEPLPDLPPAETFVTFETWTPEQDARLLELKDIGYSYAKIAVHLGRRERSVSTRGATLLKRDAIHEVAQRDVTYAQLTDEERRLVDAKLNAGLSVRAIAREMGRNWWVISTHAKFYRKRA